MTPQYVEKVSLNIREYIKKGRLSDALDLLDEFIQHLNDAELDNQILAITARYSTAIKNDITGVKDKTDEQNKIIYALSQILREAKILALEKLALSATNALEKLNQRGDEAIQNLEKMTKLMVESRLLEIEMTSLAFGRIFSTDQQARMNDHIRRFKELLD
ncbi:MAG: Effector-associated domain 11 [Bacteroidota bacterium]|jgi:hypothetical protein